MLLMLFLVAESCGDLKEKDSGMTNIGLQNGYPVLKVKVGLKTDEATIEAVRSVSSKPIRVDANEGWTDREEAIRKINWLETQGVDYVEQPMPAHMLEETKYVRSKVHLPLYADEARTEASMIPHLTEAYDGINAKLDKAGGILESLRWIEIALAVNLKVMIGCMVSSSCTVTAAAHLSPLVDYADLDGNLLVANDPWRGVRVEKGRLVLPSGPGLGLTPSYPALSSACDEKAGSSSVQGSLRPSRE